MLEITENGKITRLCFSGDIGRPDMPILRDPVIPDNLDILLMESTYGNRLHPVAGDVEEETALVLNEAS